MVVDERARHLRRLRRARRATRRWTVLAGGLTAAAGVLVPYQGLGPLDAVWAGLAGGSIMLAWWRWSDARALAAVPVPDPPDPALANDPWLSTLTLLPGGRVLAEQLRRHRTRGALRGSAGGELWGRLDRASRTMGELVDRLRAGDAEAVQEATAVERQLRQLTDRVASLEQALRLAPPEAHPPLRELRADHLEQLEQGVVAYEQFVVAAAGYLSEAVRTDGLPQPAAGLASATDRLRGVTAGLAELRARHGDLRSLG